jgi:multimeric flavodoxin WrbA
MAGADCALIDIDRLSIGRCRDCGECYRTGWCVIDDDLSYLLDSMLAADGIIMGSPAFAEGVECFMDRLGDAAHCRVLEGKYGFSISASRNGDAGFMASHIGRFMEDLGIATIGSVALYMGKEQMREMADKAAGLGGQLVDAVKNKRSYPEHERSRRKFFTEFEDAVKANKEAWAHDYRYWSDKGWLRTK